MSLDPATRAAIRKYGPAINHLARKRYGVSGQQLLGRLIVGESGGNRNATSPVGAHGLTQFMPSSRVEAMRKYGVDPWGSPDDAVHAAVLHLKGKINGSKGLEGYNPGDPNYPKYILGQHAPKDGKRAAGTPGSVTPTSGAKYKLQRGTLPSTKTDIDGALVDALLSHPKGGLLKAASAAIDSGQYTTTTPGKESKLIKLAGATSPDGEVAPAGGGRYLHKVVHRMNRIDAHHFPYLWGGGHNPATQHKAIPLDCSGAVSKVLGIDPRVASQFKNFGKPGHGRITIYAKDSHVLMSVRVNGEERFWGTSASNPGGGAGWIPRSAIGSGYLSGFTVRHV